MKVGFEQWNANGFVCKGQMEAKDIPKTLLEFERKAKELLDSTGADHVVYAWKRNGKQSGKLECVCFYEGTALDDNVFNERCDKITGIVYALHARR